MAILLAAVGKTNSGETRMKGKYVLDVQGLPAVTMLVRGKAKELGCTGIDVDESTIS